MATTPARSIDPLPDTDNVTAGPWGDGDSAPTTELSTTLKAASTTGAPWLIAKASDAKSLAGLINPEDVHPVIDAIVDNQVYFEKQYAEATGNVPAAKAPTKDSAPSGQARSCKHGEMQFRSGSSNGRAWQAYMCPTPKGTADQCPPEWVK